jgi:hypothetical protein
VSRAEKHSKVQSPLRYLALPTARLRDTGLEAAPIGEPSRFTLASGSLGPLIYLTALEHRYPTRDRSSHLDSPQENASPESEKHRRLSSQSRFDADKSHGQQLARSASLDAGSSHDRVVWYVALSSQESSRAVLDHVARRRRRPSERR